MSKVLLNRKETDELRSGIGDIIKNCQNVVKLDELDEILEDIEKATVPWDAPLE